MNTPHPYRQAAGRIGCADCGKSRTHMSHLGQGEDEPEEQQEQDSGEPPPPQAIPLAREYARQQSEQAARDESSFSITSSGGCTTVQIKVPGEATYELLLAAAEFKKAAQPKEEEK